MFDVGRGVGGNSGMKGVVRVELEREFERNIGNLACRDQG